MKKLITIAFTIMCAMSSFAQSNFKEKTVFKNADVEIRQLDEHTWHGNGHLVFNESIYLIEGEHSALLIDAGTRMPGLKKIVEDLVKKPVTLIISHGHGDHIGAINEWDSLWINAADMAIVPKDTYKGVVRYLTDGQIFDLGGRQIEVVFTPGHTPGSTTFIDKAAHYGFSSDAFGSGNLLVFTDLSTQWASCLRFSRFMEKYGIKYLYPGHYWGDNLETPQRVKDVATICDDILKGTIVPEKSTDARFPYVVDMYGVKVNFSDRQVRCGIMPLKQEVGPYTIEEIQENVFHIQDYNRQNPSGESFNENGEKTHFNNCSDMYLLVGSREALLIDLSNYIKWDDTAIESLRKLVAERVGNKPLTITFTHNHGDHTGMLPAYAKDTDVKFALPRIDFKSLKGRFPKGQYSLYDEGRCFDLGGMKVNTLLVPGHTHGSMVFFLEGRDIVFTGDAIGSGHGVWIFDTKGFKEYAKALPRFIDYVNDPKNGISPENLMIMGGHYWQKDWFVGTAHPDIDWQYVKDMQELIRQIFNGTASHEPSNLGHKTLDTYFKLNNAIIVWNEEQAKAL